MSQSNCSFKNLLRLKNQQCWISSHELKTPLTALKMQIQMIGELTKKAVQQIERLSQLIEFFFEECHFEKSIKLKKETINLCHKAQWIIDLMQDEALAANSPISLEADQPVYCYVDPRRIEQILVNLISNAIKYGNKKPVTVIISSQNGFAKMEVIDQGVGIPKNLQKKIFKPFQRLSQDNSIPGLGLGLFIVKNIVDAHHGKITLESQTNQGSKFQVWLSTEERTTAKS